LSGTIETRRRELSGRFVAAAGRAAAACRGLLRLAFEGINPFSRHKSGVALPFPRIARWRSDKPAAEPDRLEQVYTLLEPARAANG
jgi:ATP-dependent DNA ligase